MAVCIVLWFCCVFVLCSFIVLSCICLSLIKQIKWVINGTIIKQKLSSFIIRFFDSEEPDAGLHPDSLKWPDIRPDSHIRYIPTPYHRCYCTLLFLWGIPSVCLFIILFCRYGREFADKQSWWQVTLRDREFYASPTCSVSPLHTTPQPFYGPFSRDHPGEPVLEGNCWTVWCKGRLTEADTSGWAPLHPDEPVPTSTIPPLCQQNSDLLWQYDSEL